MRALNRKLTRDLSQLKGQVLTIALVVACGIASYVTLRSTWASLGYSKVTYYERYRFADVFASLRSAPLPIADRIAEIPGVATVYDRIVEEVLVPVEGLAEPASGRLISLPVTGEPPLNGVYLRSGRFPIRGRADEVLVNEPFTNAHGMIPGSRLPAVINGALRNLEVVGIGLSPEYVFPIRPGAVSADDKRLAILWMDRDVLAPAFRMEGAFNDISLKLQPGAALAAILRAIDQLLAPYGGVGAVGRDKQLSNYVLEGEMAGLESFATVVPIIFLAVAAFLLNVVLSRLVNLQRQQIAVLKALGYSNARVGLYYVELVSVIVVLGAALGVAIGSWFGSSMTDLYGDFFRFPILAYRLDGAVVVVAVAVSLAAAVVGALLSFRQVVKLPPAEAMRPPSPTSYQMTLIDRMGIDRLLGQSAMMAVRELRRRPWRTLLSSLGIAAAVGIVIVGRFGADSMSHLMENIFVKSEPGDIQVAFIEPVEPGAIRELEQLPGVLDAEGQRAVAVRFRHGHRWRDSVIQAYGQSARLRRIIDREARVIEPPRDGLGVSRKLAELLDLKAGDTLEVEVREGERKTYSLAVEVLVDDAFGLQGYMDIDALHRLLGEQPRYTTIELVIDPTRTDELFSHLKEIPSVAAVNRRQAMVDNFNDQTGNYMRVMSLVLTLFGVTIAIGVVYNNARVALSIRSRDLASLRVLGFTRGEISAVLLGELGTQIVVAIPFGLVLGTWWCHAIMNSNDPENYRMPLYISQASYAFAVLVAAGAGLISALLVRRKLDQLDLIGVLKTRE